MILLKTSRPSSVGIRRARVPARNLKQGDVVRFAHSEHLVVRILRVASPTSEVMIETWARGAHEHTVRFLKAKERVELLAAGQY